MSGIECINLLAFIQFIIAFDFGLYYLDNKHVLTEIYRKYQKDLKLSVRAVLSRANDIITESLKSENSECILNSAYLGTFIKYYKISQLIHTQSIAN